MGIVAIDSRENDLREIFRREMPIAQRWAYFDHAAVGPLPARTSAAVQHWAEHASLDGDVRWPEWAATASRLRHLASQLLHGIPDEIALVPNTTFGINVVANSFPWRSGDNLVVLENEFPSNMLPWLALADRSIEIRKVPVAPDGSVSIDRIRGAMDRSTRLVSLSWVGYATGHRLDLAKVCSMVHEAGALLFVDAIQGLGVFPLDTRSIPIDFAAADGHKWMLGPEGAGILYVRQSNLELLRPMMMGWGSIESSHEFKSDGAVYKQNASRYEGGSANHVGQIGFASSLGLLLELGCHQPEGRLAKGVLEAAEWARSELLRSGAALTFGRPHRGESLEATGSGIVSFDILGHDPYAIRKFLMDAGVVVSVRHGHLRIALHAYNTIEDIERLGQALRDATAGSRSVTVPPDSLTS